MIPAEKYIEWAGFAESMMIMAIFDMRGGMSETSWELLREETWLE